jgi:hypothetical protein
LNADTPEGHRIRGVHYKAHQSRSFMLGSVPRGRALRECGREWLESLPAWALYREGRRQYVTREAWLDFAPSAT